MSSARFRTFLAAVLVAFCAGISTPAVAEKKLSRSDKRWLEQEVVAALITEKEIEIFRGLDSAKDRKLFKELFWARRDPNPMTPQNEIKEELTRRLTTANRFFRQRGLKGSRTHMGKIFLVLGSPNQTDHSRPGPPGQAEISMAPVAGGGGLAGPDPTDSVLSTFTPSLVGLTQMVTWTYEPQPDMGIPEGLTLEFERPRDSRYRLRRSDEVDVALESVKSIYIANPGITYARDGKGHLMKPPSKLDPHSPAKLALQEMMETKTESPDIPFKTEMAFFRSTDGSYVPLLFEIDPEPLSWKGDTAEVTLFGAIENVDGQPPHRFEEQVKLTRTDDGHAVFDIPLLPPPGNYTFNLGVMDDRTNRVGTRRVSVWVPDFHQEGLAMSSVLLYREKRQVQNPPWTPGHAFQFGQVQFTPSGGKAYKPTDDLGILFFVYGFGLDEQGQPKLSTDYIFFRDGKQQSQIADQSLQANPSQAVAGLEVPLADFGFGNYQVEIKVTDHVTNKVITDRVEFGLVAESYPVGDYSDLVDSYRKGRYTEAADALSRVSKDSLKGAARNSRRRSLTEAELKAAALLHTEVVVRTGRERLFHLKAAKDYLQRIEDVSRRRDFERRWFLALCHHFQRSPRSWGVLPFLDVALKLLPEDPEIRLAMGSVWETAGWMGDERLLKRAEEQYRWILEANPDHAEAHLRLGRVLQLTGRRAKALRELQWSVDHADDPRFEFAAHVLLGDLYNQQGKLPQAIQSFQAALAIDPRCQAAAVALSHALHRAGDRTGSREVLDRFLSDKSDKGSPSGETDGWWRYLLGSSERVDSILGKMREEVLQ